MSGDGSDNKIDFTTSGVDMGLDISERMINYIGP